MKTLIITTGTEEWLNTKLLPSLYSIGKYQGNVIVIDYDNMKHYPDRRVKYYHSVKKYLRFTTDRFRAFSECLGFADIWKCYDVIMHVDGNDIEFVGDIVPLLDQVKDKLLVVQEPNNNDFVKYWKSYWELPDEMREAIALCPIINAGMFLGPARLMVDVIFDIANLEEYDTRFGMDQLALNCLCYYYKAPFTVVDRKWDWFDSWGTEPDAKILHHAGVNGKKPDETDFVKNEGNWLFPVYHKDTNNHTEQPTHKGNWLFP